MLETTPYIQCSDQTLQWNFGARLRSHIRSYGVFMPTIFQRANWVKGKQDPDPRQPAVLNGCTPLLSNSLRDQKWFSLPGAAWKMFLFLFRLADWQGTPSYHLSFDRVGTATDAAAYRRLTALRTSPLTRAATLRTALLAFVVSIRPFALSLHARMTLEMTEWS